MELDTELAKLNIPVLGLESIVSNLDTIVLRSETILLGIDTVLVRLNDSVLVLETAVSRLDTIVLDLDTVLGLAGIPRCNLWYVRAVMWEANYPIEMLLTSSSSFLSS